MSFIIYAIRTLLIAVTLNFKIIHNRGKKINLIPERNIVSKNVIIVYYF